MELSTRQKQIVEIVKQTEPISGDKIAKQLGLSRATLRSDLSVLTMTGILDARPKVGYFYSGQVVEPLLYERLFETKISDIMVPPLVIRSDLSIYDAVTTLFLYDVGSLYVTDDEKKLLGVISRKDLLRALLNNPQAHDTPVAVIMTRSPNIITTNSSVRVIDAGYMIMQHQVDSLPVIHPTTEEVVGKVSKTKIMEYFIKAGLKIEKEVK